MLNPWAIVGGLVGLILWTVGIGWLSYDRGRDDSRNYYTTRDLNTAIADKKATEKKVAASQTAGAQHDVNNIKVNVDTKAIARSLEDLLKKLPSEHDPFMPVWFVRLHDRAASRWVDGDPYPGKPDDTPSDVRMSKTLAVLTANYGRCEANRVQLQDTIRLKPVLPNTQ